MGLKNNKKRLSRGTGKQYFVTISFLFPYLLLFSLFTILPVLVSIVLSFTSFNALETPVFVGWENYTRMFLNDSVFKIALKNTFLIAVITGPVGYLLSLALAWFVNELNPKMRAFVTLIFYSPSIAGNAYMIWKLLFSSDEYGYANSILITLGIIKTPIQWLTNTDYMLTIVIIVTIWMSMGTGFLSFVAGFQGIDRSYYEAGAVDGIKNRWQELWFVTLPLIKPQMMFAAVMSITSAFGVGDVVTNLCGSPSTDYAAHTIMNHLQDYGGVKYEMGYASALATFLFMLMVLSNIVIKKMIAKVGD